MRAEGRSRLLKDRAVGLEAAVPVQERPAPGGAALFGEMDMGFWMEQGKAEKRALGGPSKG